MITSKEIQMYIPYAPTATCESISKYISSMYRNRYYFIDDATFAVAVVDILERVGHNYNPDLGHLNRYAKNTLALKLKDFVARKHKNTEELSEEIEVPNLNVSQLANVDLSTYSDTVISAIYKVINGTGGKRDMKVIEDTFNVKE